MTLDRVIAVCFVAVAFVASCWYGKNAVAALTQVKEQDINPSALWHQRWFNFLGAAIGWGVAWLALHRVWPALRDASAGGLVWTDGALVAVAFVGVTGHLPYAAAGLLEGLMELADKLIGSLKGPG